MSRQVKAQIYADCLPIHLFIPTDLETDITYSLKVHIWDKPDTCYRQACLINRQAGKCNRQAAKLTDRPVARWLKLGADTRVGNGRRNIEHV